MTEPTQTTPSGCWPSALRLFGVVVLLFLSGTGGCVVASRIQQEFYGGQFTNWRYVATAPAGTVGLTDILACADPNLRHGRVLVRQSDGSVMMYEDCDESTKEWLPAEDALPFGTHKCDWGRDPDFATAERKWARDFVDCRDVVWSWETWDIRARYVLDRDMQIYSWPRGGGPNAFFNGVGFGYLGGAALGIAGLVLWSRRKSRSRKRG